MAYSGYRFIAGFCFLLCAIPPWFQAIVFAPIGLWALSRAKSNEQLREQRLQN